MKQLTTKQTRLKKVAPKAMMTNWEQMLRVKEKNTYKYVNER